MNVFIFCAVLSFSSFILAFKMSFHTVDLEVLKCEEKPVLVCTKHKFIYHRGDEFTLHIKLMNKSLDVTNASAIVKTSGGAYFSKEFWFEGSTFHFIQKSNGIKIDVELVVNNTCVRQRVLEGRVASTRTTLQKEINITAFKYNDICLKGNQCMVIVDPTRECKGAANTYFIIIIVTSILTAVALIMLLVFAIRCGCWISNPPGVPQTLPTNPNPFYENVHLRTEGQKEIEELEQRVYDQVPAENEYEEIRDHSSTKWL